MHKFENIKLQGLDSDQLIENFVDAIQTKATIYFLDGGKINLNGRWAENILYFDGNTIIYSIDTLEFQDKMGEEYTAYDLSYDLISGLREDFCKKIETIIYENKNVFKIIEDKVYLENEVLFNIKDIETINIQEASDILTNLIKSI